MELQILSSKQVCQRLSIERTAFWQLEKSGDFPKASQITLGRKGFLASEIDVWIKRQATKRDGVAA